MKDRGGNPLGIIDITAYTKPGLSPAEVVATARGLASKLEAELVPLFPEDEKLRRVIDDLRLIDPMDIGAMDGFEDAMERLFTWSGGGPPNLGKRRRTR